MMVTSAEVRRPLDLSRIVIDLEQKTYFITLNISNKSGALASFLSILKKHDLNLIGIISEAISRKEEIEISMFLEAPVKMGREELEKLLTEEIAKEKIDVVRGIKIFEHLEGYDADVYHFPLTMGDMRAVIFPMNVLESLIAGIRQTFDTPVVQTMLWYQGREIGKNMLELCREKYGVTGIRALEFLKTRALILGWALIETSEFDEKMKKARIRVFENWECLMFKDSNVPQSHFLRGFLAGFFSSLFEVEVEVSEAACISKGDPYCEFVVQQKKGETVKS
jgi:predicted hydrocarbon binding protein